MEALLRILLGLLLAVSGLAGIFAPDMVPLDANLPVKIGMVLLGAWLLSGICKDQSNFVLRLIIGGTFVYAAFDKIMHPDQFARIIYNYHQVPGQLINIFALFLPWVEIISGILIIVGYWEKAATLIIGGMLVMFIIALTQALIKGVNIECGCFSTTSKAKGPVKDLIFRDALMLLACGVILWTKKSWLAIESRHSRR